MENPFSMKIYIHLFIFVLFCFKKSTFICLKKYIPHITVFPNGRHFAPQPLSLSVFFLKFILAALGLSYGI